LQIHRGLEDGAELKDIPRLPFIAICLEGAENFMDFSLKEAVGGNQ
jgi:hypothetical protein